MTTTTVEVDLADQDGCVVEHGTCTVEVGPDGQLLEAHSFRSSAKPEDDWPLPAHHSFRLNLPA